MIQIKNAKELDGMRKANALSAAALKYVCQHTLIRQLRHLR